MGQVSDRAIEIATQYLGKVESKLTPNAAPWLQELMDAAYNPTGWRQGESYCIAALCSIFETVMIENSLKFPFAYSKSTQLFYNTAAKNNFVSQTPDRGDIVIFEIGTTGSGHAELITGVSPDGITTIGFNTSSTVAGNQSNGEGCFSKFRRYKDFPKTDRPHLWIRGYVKTSSL